MGNIKDKVYRFSPLFIKTVLLNLVALKNNKNRFSKPYYGYLEEYQALWKLERIDILEYQSKMLIKLLKECYEYVPYYKKDFLNKNISLDDIDNDPYMVLSKLNILGKQDRKRKAEELVNNHPNRKVSEIGFTSGTSGAPTKTYLDEESTNRSFALWTRFHKNIDIKRGDKNIRFSGRLIVNPERTKPPFWMYNIVEKQLFMSTYHLRKENIKDYIKKLNKFKPILIDGYPSALYIIAQQINSNSIKLNFTPKALVVTAETLYDYQREEIENAFNCKVYNQYASSEGSPPITECQFGRLHVNEDSGVFEFLNSKNEKAKPGEIAKMVVTSFRNWKTPLVRYDIEDTVLLPEIQQTCECGCKMFYVDKIIGREDDVLWTEEKGYVGRMDTAYKGLNGIIKSQLVQKSKNLLIVNQIIDENYSTKMNQLFINNLKDRLGRNIEIRINIVKDIPLGANGKFDAVKREFKIDN
ncbi:phenylacetate--CoA ligase family protein [Brumimicrobium mesophilum]|uniref:phenylacetate--CoA ligase family protein n=1 Tax=Brumimicrobium mesophilum TaxID=392717 RepID=UPI000D14227D|nr:phenylacetate--CoA ligase family protein [Brumimicrobium mesophilum]